MEAPGNLDALIRRYSSGKSELDALEYYKGESLALLSCRYRSRARHMNSSAEACFVQYYFLDSSIKLNVLNAHGY